MDELKGLALDALLSQPAARKLTEALETITKVQQTLYALYTGEDGMDLKLLRIGTVFQLFLVDTLASGKKPGELTQEDWRKIADKVSTYAILKDGQAYSEFVFDLYADYIKVSAATVSKLISEDALRSITEVETALRQNGKKLKNGELAEPDYVEECLWLSLEAMIKLLSATLSAGLGEEFSRFAQAVSQLAIAYGRCVLYSQEQAILEEYLQHQYRLDGELQQKYDAFLRDLEENAARFRGLVDAAFTPELHLALRASADLARAAGVKEDEILESVEDIDSFFLD